MKHIPYLAIAGLCWLAVSPAMAAQMSIQVEAGQLREKPSVFGRILATVPYGERVEILQRNSPWFEVRRADGLAGWMHESILTKKKLELSAGAQDVSRAASGEELAMAGKGFNSQVEADFKEKNQNIDFAWIDRMETYKVDEKQIVEFLDEGGLGQ